MTTLMVTGGAGFIGSHFVKYWLAQHTDDCVINLDLLTYAGNLENLKDVESTFGERYRFVHGDIGNLDLVLYVLNEHHVDIIVNFAAESHNSRGVVNPDIFFKTNAVGTQVLLEAALRAETPRVHHISTTEVYGDLALDSPERFTEESPLRPRTPYNASKAAADLAVRAYFETFGLPITISNCSNNYGSYQFPEKVIPYFTTRALLGHPLPLYKNSANRREWLHVIDHCRAIELVLARGRIGETYNVGSAEEADVETIADLVLSTLELDRSRKEYVPDRPGHDRRYLLDSTKIRQELGWRPTVLLKDGIPATVKWYRDHRSWWERLLPKLDVNEEAWGAPAAAQRSV